MSVGKVTAAVVSRDLGRKFERSRPKKTRLRTVSKRSDGYAAHEELGAVYVEHFGDVDRYGMELKLRCYADHLVALGYEVEVYADEIRVTGRA